MATFKFRQFSVCDDHAAMKVGTDAVLLGAWATTQDVQTVLDVGTGSGVIALMLAQRCASASLTAVEIMAPDFDQACENFRNSPWASRISSIHSDIQNFRTGTHFDLIVCNPPFFIDSLQPPGPERGVARHAGSLSHEALLVSTKRLLSEDGKLSIILPPAEAEIFVEYASASGLKLQRLTTFYSRAHKPKERAIMQFGFESVPLESSSLILYNDAGRWSDEYWELTGEFYLKRL